jgi:hypothetical protein
MEAAHARALRVDPREIDACRSRVGCQEIVARFSEKVSERHPWDEGLVEQGASHSYVELSTNEAPPHRRLPENYLARPRCFGTGLIAGGTHGEIAVHSSTPSGRPTDGD